MKLSNDSMLDGGRRKSANMIGRRLSSRKRGCVERRAAPDTADILEA
jgi:hypothetical protein